MTGGLTNLEGILLRPNRYGAGIRFFTFFRSIQITIDEVPARRLTFSNSAFSIIDMHLVPVLVCNRHLKPGRSTQGNGQDYS